MGMLISSVNAMSTFHPEGTHYRYYFQTSRSDGAFSNMTMEIDEASTALQGSTIYTDSPALAQKQIFRLIGKMPTLAACAYVRVSRESLSIGVPLKMPTTLHRNRDTE